MHIKHTDWQHNTDALAAIVNTRTNVLSEVVKLESKQIPKEDFEIAYAKHEIVCQISAYIPLDTVRLSSK